MIVTPVTVKGKETENKESTNLDNKWKRSPKETLFLLMFFKGWPESSPAVYSQKIEVWQSVRGMQGEMKEKHPCESEWYAKALRRLLV